MLGPTTLPYPVDRRRGIPGGGAAGPAVGRAGGNRPPAGWPAGDRCGQRGGGAGNGRGLGDGARLGGMGQVDRWAAVTSKVSQ